VPRGNPRGKHSLAHRPIRARRLALVAAPVATALAVGVGVLTSGFTAPEDTGSASGNLSAAARPAQEAATTALDAARQVAVNGSIADAAPNALTAVAPTVLFIDGPSTGPSVVSVYAGAAGWAAAVHGAHATCYWVAVAAEGGTRYGTGSACTGMSALAADRPAW